MKRIGVDVLPLVFFWLGVVGSLWTGASGTAFARRMLREETSGGCEVKVDGPGHLCISKQGTYTVRYYKHGEEVPNGFTVTWALVSTPDGSANQYRPGKGGNPGNPPPMTSTPALTYNDKSKQWEFSHALGQSVTLQWNGSAQEPNKEGKLKFKITVQDVPPCSHLYEIDVDESLTIPLCVRQVEGAGGTTITLDKPFRTKLESELNAIWSHCCIYFKVEDPKADEKPADWKKAPWRPNGDLPVADNDQQVKMADWLKPQFKATNHTTCLNLYFVKNAIFSKVGSGDVLGIADIGDNGAVVDENVSSGVTAHELGHNFGLKDNYDPKAQSNLMFGIEKNPDGVGKNTEIDEKQCEQARNQVRQFLRKFQKGK